MEVLVVQAKKYLSATTPAGFTALHAAAIHGHSRICSLLAAEVYIFMLASVYSNLDVGVD